MQIDIRERNSHMILGVVYFWTATIHKWHKLLLDDSYKDIILNSLKYLHNKDLIEIFGFVVMPTHVHIIWRLKRMNGMEMPHTSFLKFTSHAFKKKLYSEDKDFLNCFMINAKDREFRFWQRDALAISLFTKKVAIQKLNYIHRNPIASHWQMVKIEEMYKYSSAGFYNDNRKDFGFLKNLYEEFIFGSWKLEF